MCYGGGKEQEIQPAEESVHLQPTTRPTTFLWPQPGRRGHPQAPGAAPRASEAVLARVEDAQGTPAALQDTDGGQGQQHCLFPPSPPNLGLHPTSPLPTALPSCTLPPYIQQSGAPAGRGGVAGGLRSQTLDEGGRGAPGSSHSCTVLGQQPWVSKREQPRLRGIAGAPALAEAAVAAWQAVGSPAVHDLGGQAVGGGAPQAAGAP